MVWRRYPIHSLWRDMEEMRAELDSMFQNAPAGNLLLPPGGMTDRMLPATRGEFRVDVREHEGEVIVVADLPGVEKEAVSLQLLNPRALEISCEKSKNAEKNEEGYYVRERSFGLLRRIIALPIDVTEDDAKASFRNGVLEVTLKKAKINQRSRIAIQ